MRDRGVLVRGVVASVALVTAVTACGSTNLPERRGDEPGVAVSEVEPGGSTTGEGSTADGGAAEPGQVDDRGGSEVVPGGQDRAPASTTGGGATASDGGDPAGDGASGGATGDGASGASGATGGSEPDPTSPEGRGYTATEIAIGLQFTEDVQAGFSVVGAEGNPPNDQRVAQAMVDWVNANGGIAGRTVVPVYHSTSVTNGTFASQAQAACSTFTEDHEVVAAVSGPVTVGDALLACLAQKQTPLVEINYWHFDQPYWDEYTGLLYRPGRMRPERWGRVYVDGLRDAGFFGDGVTRNRVGLLRFDAPVYDRISNQVIKPRMAELGLELDDEIEITTPPSIAAFGQMSGELQNAIVRLRSQGIEHVMFIENGAVMTFFFAQQAESQGYRPVYGVSSADTPSTLAQQAPPAQLEGSVGIGWQPGIDLYHPDYLDGQPNRELCARIMDEAGVTRTYPTRGYYTLSRCDALLFLKAALDRAPDLSPAGLLRATESLGSDYRSPFAFETRLGPGRYDGASGARLLRYARECECYRYEGPGRATE